MTYRFTDHDIAALVKHVNGHLEMLSSPYRITTHKDTAGTSVIQRALERGTQRCIGPQGANKQIADYLSGMVVALHMAAEAPTL